MEAHVQQAESMTQAAQQPLPEGLAFRSGDSPQPRDQELGLLEEVRVVVNEHLVLGVEEHPVLHRVGVERAEMGHVEILPEVDLNEVNVLGQLGGDPAAVGEVVTWGGVEVLAHVQVVGDGASRLVGVGRRGSVVHGARMRIRRRGRGNTNVLTVQLHYVG